jgi:hypothetical protein
MVRAGEGGRTSRSQKDFCGPFNFNSTEEYYEHLLSTSFADDNPTGLTQDQEATAMYNSAVERCGGSDGFAHGIQIQHLGRYPRFLLWCKGALCQVRTAKRDRAAFPSLLTLSSVSV